MSYQDQDHDSLTEELEAPDLLTDFKEIYQTNQADLQSLTRIRAHLQDLPATMQIGGPTVPLPLKSRPLENSKHIYRVSDQEKSTLHRNQLLNKGISLLLIASIVGAFAVTFTWFHHSSSTRNAGHPAQMLQDNAQQPHQPFPWGYFVLANPTTAWLPTSVPLPGGNSVQGPLLRTIDAGRTWQDVTPPQLGFDPGYILHALKDGKTAWLLKQVQPEKFLYQTRNGGQTWQRFSLPQGIFVNTLAFVDPDHGWFLGLQNFKGPSVLFSTTNGGKVWQQLSAAPLLQTQSQTAQMQFFNTQTGWLNTTTKSGQNTLFVTHTAGSSWSPLPLLENIKNDSGGISFTFTTEKQGYLTIGHYQQGKQNITLYETRDGGQTWQKPTFEPPMSDKVINPVYLSDQQILVQHGGNSNEEGNTITVYKRSNNRWVQSSSHTLTDGQLFSTSFLSSTTGLGIVDYSKPPTFTNVSNDQIGLVKTTDGGATWTKVPLTVPTEKVTAATMAYLTYPGWTYYTADEGNGSETFTPTVQSAPANLQPHLAAKTWLVRFMCTAPTTTLTLNGKQLSASGCSEHPISTVVTFDTSQSIQTLKVVTQKQASWLAVIEVCTNEKMCKTHLH